MKAKIVNDIKKQVFSKPTNRVRCVVMMDRENEEMLYKLGDGRISRGLDVVFEMLKFYQKGEKSEKKSSWEKKNFYAINWYTESKNHKKI